MRPGKMKELGHVRKHTYQRPEEYEEGFTGRGVLVMKWYGKTDAKIPVLRHNIDIYLFCKILKVIITQIYRLSY